MTKLRRSQRPRARNGLERFLSIVSLVTLIATRLLADKSEDANVSKLMSQVKVSSNVVSDATLRDHRALT
jgi:hypothetical protein